MSTLINSIYKSFEGIACKCKICSIYTQTIIIYDTWTHAQRKQHANAYIRNNISFSDYGEIIIDLYIQPLFIIHEIVQREQLASVTTLKLFIIHCIKEQLITGLLVYSLSLVNVASLLYSIYKFLIKNLLCQILSCKTPKPK